MIRVLERPGARLRIWTPPDAPTALGGGDPAFVTVECWRGGCTSTYGMLGATRAGGASDSVPDLPAGPFAGALPRLSDVQFGLPDEYRPAIAAAAPELVVRIAAHDPVGSSGFVFYSLAAIVDCLISRGLPDHDERIWRSWNTAAEQARQWAQAPASATASRCQTR